MLNIKSKRCKEPKCNVHPSFGLPGGVIEFCSEHKKLNMTDLKSKKCKEPGCNLGPSYGLLNGVVEFCSKHKKLNMIDLKSKKCKEPECNLGRLYGLPNGVAEFCSKHKKLNMVNFSKKCKKPECKLRPSYGLPENVAEFCSKHKKLNMINLVKKKCKYAGCNKLSNYNIFGFPRLFCRYHGPKGSRKNPNPKCKRLNCGFLATHGEEVGKEYHCEHHYNPETEKDLHSQKCISCGLMELLDQNQLCYNSCNPEAQFKFLHWKELKVRETFDARNFKFEYKNDVMIDNGECGKERPDFLFDCGTHFLICEIDENQHFSRPCECEQTRMVDLSQSLSLQTIIVRYNPDMYYKKIGEKRESYENHNSRMKILCKWIEYYLSNKPNDFLEVVYLFFDEWNGVAKVETILKFDN